MTYAIIEAMLHTIVDNSGNGKSADGHVQQFITS